MVVLIPSLGVFSLHFDNNLHVLCLGKVVISALPPISTEGLTMDDVDSLMDKVRESMKTEFSKITKEVKSDLLPPYRSTGCKSG